MDSDAPSLEHTLEAVRQRHLELIVPRVSEASRPEAIAAGGYATSEHTKSLLLGCTYPILWFAQAELDPAAPGNARRLIVAMRRPIRKVPVAEVQNLLALPIQRLLVAGLGAAATLIGPIGATNRQYGLIENIETLMLPTSGRLTFKLWERAAGRLIRDLLASPPEGRQLISVLGHADVEQFLLAARALGKLGERKPQGRLREFADEYLFYGYALYMINTNGVRDQIERDEMAQMMVDVAMEISPADFGLPASDR